MTPSPLLRFPRPLKAGSRVVVTAPSSGVEPPLHPRLELCLQSLRHRGWVVEEGQCLRDEVDGASASAELRAAELQATLMRDDVDALIPPWGGELAIEVLERLDWAALAHARPKWVLGYSDTSTWMLALTLRLGWATAHGPCLMDLVPGQDQALAALEQAPGAVWTQAQSQAWQKQWSDFAAEPASTYRLTEPTQWRSLHGRDAERMQGRLIGGCIDTLVHTAGTAFGDVARFTQQHRDDGVLLYLENAEGSSGDWVRAWHRLRFSGWTEGLAGVLIGRNAVADSPNPHALHWTEALRNTAGALPCPVLLDVDIGHVPPQLLLVNGARATVAWSQAGGGQITQQLA
jgi:muramoyltetrapeptide carboxypeptidase